MAVTAQTRDTIIGLSVAMLGKAPGTALLNEWYGVYNASVDKGMSPEMALLEVANHIAASSAFTSMYPFFITNAEFARDFLTAALGEAPAAEVLALATGLLNGGMGRGEMGLLAVRQLFEIRMQGESHPAYGDFGALAMMFANKVEVATYYTVTKRWEGDSASVLGGVTGDGDSVTAAKEAIDMMRRPGKSFELTTGVDRLDGTLGDDTFVATEKTLTGVDRLDGGEGMDTLELSSSGSDDDVSVSSGASVMNVETLTVDSGGDFEAELGGWEGLKEVVLSDVEGDVELDAGGADVMSKSLGDDDAETTVDIMNAAAIKLEGVSKMADVDLYDTDTTTSIMVEGGKTVDVGKEDAPSATVESVTLDDVHDGLGEPDKRGKFKEDDKIDGTAVTADQITASADTVPVHIFSTAIADISLANTNTTLLVQNDVKGDDPTSLTAMVDKFGLYSTASEHGKLCLKGIEDLAIEVKGDSNIRLASDEIETVSVSGAGKLMLDVTKFKPAVNPTEADPIVISATLKSIDASEATGDVKVSRLGKSVESYMGGSGKDDVTVTEFHKDGLKAELGEGDDMFTIGAGVVVSAKSRVDGGAGEDTLMLTANKASQLKNVDDDVFMNFEKTTLTVEADKSAAAGNYDVEGLMLHELKVTKGTSTLAAAPAIKFKNIQESGTDLVVTASSGVIEFFDVSYMLEDDADDAEVNLKLQQLAGAAAGADADEVLARADIEKGRIYHTRLHTKLELDKSVESLNLESIVVRGRSTLDLKNYANIIREISAPGLEELKITGNGYTMFYTEETLDENLKDGTGSSDSRFKAGNLEHIDARGSGGVQFNAIVSDQDMEIHGSSHSDVLLIANRSSDGESSIKKNKLMGYGGDDYLAGGGGEDQITGGAGGDEMTGAGVRGWNPTFYDNSDDAKDTFIYEKYTDSQINFGDEMSGFDTIFHFRDEDRIDLRKVVDLTGETLRTHDDQTGTLKDFIDTNSKTLFTKAADGNSFATRHSVAVVETMEEPSFDNIFGIAILEPDEVRLPGEANNENEAPSTDKVGVTWILVDADGDGSFSAGADMAIALFPGNSASITADNFVV